MTTDKPEVHIDLTGPFGTPLKELAAAYRQFRIQWMSAALAGDPVVIEQVKIKMIEAADALCVAVLNS